MMRGLFLALPAIGLMSCATAPSGNPSNLTHGGVQLYLKKGQTTQTEVLEKFGAPNIATVDGEGHEVWTYQKHATVSNESSGYATIILLGKSSSGFEQSSRTMTLIIKFNDKKIVSDFNSMYSSF